MERDADIQRDTDFSTQGQNPLGRNLKDMQLTPLQLAVGRCTAESMNHGFNDGAQRPMVQIDSLRRASSFKRLSECIGSVCSAEELKCGCVVSELQVSVFPASAELKRILTDVLLAKIEKANTDRY